MMPLDDGGKNRSEPKCRGDGKQNQAEDEELVGEVRRIDGVAGPGDADDFPAEAEMREKSPSGRRVSVMSAAAVNPFPCDPCRQPEGQ